MHIYIRTYIHTHIHTQGLAVEAYKVVQKGHFSEDRIRELFASPGRVPGCSGARKVEDNLSDLQAQIAANQKVVMCVCVCVCVCAYVCMYMRMYVFMYLYVCMYVYAEIICKFWVCARLPVVRVPGK